MAFCPSYVETDFFLKGIWLTSPSVQQPPSSWHHQVPRKFTLDYKANDQNNADHSSTPQWCVLTSFCLEKRNGITNFRVLLTVRLQRVCIRTNKKCCSGVFSTGAMAPVILRKKTNSTRSQHPHLKNSNK